MANQQLLDYIKQQGGTNANQEGIKSALIAKGWLESDVDEAFNTMNPTQQPADIYGSAVSEPNQPKKKLNKVLLIVAIVVACILLAGGGVFAYFYYFPAPATVLQKMMAKIQNVKSLEYSGDAKFKIIQDQSGEFGVKTDPKTINFSLNFDTTADFHNPDNHISSATVKMSTDVFSALLGSESQPAEPMSIELETRNVNKAMYFRLAGLPNLGFLDLSSVKSQWIKIDLESLKKELGSSTLGDQITKAEQAQKLSPEQLNQLRDAVKKANIVKIIATLPGEKIDGASTYHYQFAVDQAGLEELLKIISSLNGGLGFSEKDWADWEKKISETIELTKGEIWIGRGDYLPRKILINLNLKDANNTGSTGTASLTFLFSNFNKSFTVEAPADAKLLTEIIQNLLGGFINSSPLTPIASAAPDSDHDGLTDAQEAQYGTDLNKADTDGDGFTDGQEVRSRYNPLGSGKMLMLHADTAKTINYRECLDQEGHYSPVNASGNACYSDEDDLGTVIAGEIRETNGTVSQCCVPKNPSIFY